MAARKRAGRLGELTPEPSSEDTESTRAKPTRLSKSVRVERCMRLMAGGSWVTGVTARQLAELWGIPLGTVENDSAEASRRLKDGGSDEELRARLRATLETVTAETMRRHQYRTTVEAVKALAEIAGVEAAKKVDVDVGGNLADILALGATGPSRE